MVKPQKGAPPPSGLDNFLGHIAAFGAFVERREYVVLVAGLVIFFVRSLVWSQATPMIPDELLAYASAQLPTPGAVWTTLATMPTTLDPPLNPFLSFLALRLPLPATLALRIPAMLCFAAMMLSVFVFVRRRLPPTAALLAFALPMTLPVVSFSIQSRPYALWLAASGWALVCWQSAVREGGGTERRRILSLWGLYASLTAAILAHYVGALIFLPLVAGELWRSRKTGRDLPVWLTFAAAAAAIAVYVPFLKASAIYRVHPWHGVVPHDLEETYLLGISAVALGIIILSVAAHMLGRESIGWNGRETAFTSSECVTLTVLYTIPIFMFAAALLVTHSYVSRYSVIFSIAAVCLMAALLFTLTRKIQGLAAILLTILFVRAALPPSSGVHFTQATGGITASLPPAIEKLPGLPVVMPIWDSYLRFCLYGPDALKKRMLLVWDPEQLTEFGDNASLQNQAVQRIMNSPFALAPEFFRTHRDFLLVGNFALRDRLIADGWRVTMLGKAYGWDLYRVTAK